MNLRLIILPLAFFLSSCGGGDEQSYNEKAYLHVLENKQKWDFTSLVDYSFTYRRSPGDCPTADEIPAMDITVEDGLVTSVYWSGTSTSTDISNGVTINQIFELVTKLAQEKSLQFTSSANVKALPLFDDNLGYPVSFYFDKSSSDCDALFNRVSNFK
tara:strand:- start:985 stop:1458 length:474 start_codon:yes stop_codon:yes gene_type:complete